MREEVKKYVFIGAESSRLTFFQEAQKQGIIHFINSKGTASREIPEEIQKLGHAIKILRSLPPLEEIEFDTFAEAPSCVEKILNLKHSIQALEERERLLNLEISRISVFGQFSLEDIRYLNKEGGRFLQFYSAKEGLILPETLPQDVIHIGSDHGLDYFVGIHKEPKGYDKMVEMHFDQSLNEMRSSLKEARAQLHAKEVSLKEMARYNRYLHRALIDVFNKHDLRINQMYPKQELEGALFAIEGWVPDNKLKELQALAASCGIYYAQVALDANDAVPTCLVNKGLGAIGEDLVHIYDTPSHRDRDPSLWVLSAFAIFFAMIVGDAGYGLIYLLIALYLRYRFSDAKGVKKRALDLSSLLCVSCMIWGVLTHSFFGMELSKESLLKKASILNYLSEKKAAWHFSLRDKTYQKWAGEYPRLSEAKTVQQFFEATDSRDQESLFNRVVDSLNRGILLELSLLMGMIHISLSFLRYLDRNWGGIGWVTAIIGSYLYFPHYLGEGSLLHYAFGLHQTIGESEGFQLMMAGIGGALGLALIQNRLSGLTEAMNLIQVFADILSYLRLYALGLAGAIVSETINQMSSVLPFLIAMILIMAAHFVNMALGIMSGIIHGLRLNFLEWYHYSFEGGGKPFRPLKLFEYD